MKRLISLVSWLGLPVSALLVCAVLNGAASKTYHGAPKLPSAPSALPVPFSEFPLDQPRRVSLDADEQFASLTRREQADQMRDWLVFAIAMDSGMGTNDLNRSLFDLSPIRHDYLRSLVRFEYGKTRYFSFGNAEIVALIPRGDEKQRADYLSHIFDDARKNLGVIPERLQVFEYEFRGTESAEVTRRGSLPGQTLLTAPFGYYEKLVTSKADLDDFVSKIDDVIAVKVDERGLRISGRKLQSGTSRRIRTGDVAAIWQADREIQRRREALEKREKDFDKEWQAKVDQFNRKWRSQSRSQQFQYEAEWTALDAQCKSAREQLKRELLAEFETHRIVAGSGFSLDPTYDFHGLAEVLSKPTLSAVLHAVQAPPGNAMAVPEAWHKTAANNMVPMSREAPGVKLSDVLEVAGVTAEDFKHVVQSLSKDQPDIIPFLEMDDKIARLRDAGSDKGEVYGILRGIFYTLREKYSFQAARYDGPLNGTEVGMVLFYTDLLAKLWAMDYLSETPSQQIEGFEPITRVTFSPVYYEETRKLPSTRLWFGPEDRGYQVSNSTAMLFARNATRIYAASSNPLNPGAEVAPNAESEAFLGWWNEHYEEVAQYEPEYERLNETMKWSLLISWLDSTNREDLLGFLSDIPVDRSAWFPEWVAQTPHKGFSRWENVPFFGRGYLGISTESMPLLRSSKFTRVGEGQGPEQQFHYLIGGVSLGSKELFEIRAPLSSEVPAFMRRSELDYAKSLTKDVDELVTVRGTKYRFTQDVDESPKRFHGQEGREAAVVKVFGSDGAKYRSRIGEIAPGDLERSIVRQGDAMRVSARSTHGDIGALQIEKSKNGFRLGWRAREMDDGFTLCQRLSRSEDLAGAIRNEPQIEFAVQDRHTSEYFIKMPATKRWMKLAPEGAPRQDLAKGWAARVAAPEPRSQRLEFTWVEQSNLPEDIWQQGRWERGPPPIIPPSPPDSLGPVDWLHSKKDFTKAASEIERDPVGFKTQYEKVVTKRAREIDDLLEKGDPRRALDEAEMALLDFGPRPDLLLWHAIAKLADHDVSAAADIMNDIDVADGGNGEKLLGEINDRLKAAGPEEQENLRRCAELIGWRASNTKPPADQIFLVPDNKTGTLSLDAHLVNPKLGKVLGKAGDYKGEPLYYQDTPGLNNLDWNTSNPAALDQVLSHHLGEAIRLPREDLAHFDPTNIHIDGTPFKRAAERTQTPSPKQSFYPRWAPNPNPTPSPSPADINDGPKDQLGNANPNYVYVVIAHPTTVENH
jgi:hypothetical protein